MTSDMTNSIGRALEEVSRATGSVAHFYRTLHIQEQPGQCRLDTRAFNPEFRPIIEQVGSIVAGPSGVHSSQSQASQASPRPRTASASASSAP